MRDLSVEDMLKNLLARIHRDGGHHTDQYGLFKSYLHADLKVAELNVLSDQAKVHHDPGDCGEAKGPSPYDPVPGVRW